MPTPKKVTRRPDRVAPPTPAPARAVPPQQRSPEPAGPKPLTWVTALERKGWRKFATVMVATPPGPHVYELHVEDGRTMVVVKRGTLIAKSIALVNLDTAKRWCAQHHAEQRARDVNFSGVARMHPLQRVLPQGGPR